MIELSPKQEKALNALRKSLKSVFAVVARRYRETGCNILELFKKLRPHGSFVFDDTRHCRQRKEDVTFPACLGCWHLGQYPKGFNFKGCQLAHITPSLQGLAYGGYGAVGDYEERTSR